MKTKPFLGNILYILKKIYFIKDELCFYRQRPNSIMAQSNAGASFIIDYLYNAEEILKYMLKFNKFEVPLAEYLFIISFLKATEAVSNDEAYKKIVKFGIELAKKWFPTTSNPLLQGLIS